MTQRVRSLSHKVGLGSILFLLVAGLPYGSWGVLVPGVVRVVETGEPVPHAVVRIQTSTDEVISDATGEFQIELPAGLQKRVTAGKFGFYNNGVFYTAAEPPTPITIFLTPIPESPNLENPYNDPSTSCNVCHGSYFTEWRGTGGVTPSRHATAGSNTWVRDLYDGTGTGGGEDQPGYVFKRDSSSLKAGSPYTTGLCAECHLPLLTALLPDDTAPGDRTELSAATSESPEGSIERMAHDYGVACEACHKLDRVEQTNGFLGRTGFYGKAHLQATDTALQFGPLDDSVIHAQPMMRAAYNPLHSESLLCAACHEYNMDHDFDGDFDEPGSPPGQTTYSEWLASPYSVAGIQCQDCHMSSDESLDQVGIGGPQRPPSQVHNHRFEGTTQALLESAVTLVVDASKVGDELHARVEVLNTGCGHSFPTGFTTRNAILSVTATTNLGEQLTWLAQGTDLVPEWGGAGSEPNDYGLKPGRGYARVLYGRGDVEGTTKERVIFIDALGEKSNTLIPAAGSDVSRYRFSVKDLQGLGVMVEAKLIYRRMWKDMVEAKGWTLDGQGNPYGDVLVSRGFAAVPLIEPGTPTSTPTPSVTLTATETPTLEATPTATETSTLEATSTATPVPDTPDLVTNGRCDALDLLALLRDRYGVLDLPTNFDGQDGEDLKDIFYFARRWHSPPSP